MSPPPQLPASYAALSESGSLPGLRLSHVPASATSAPTPVVVVALHRPERRNSFTDGLVASLVRALDLLGADPRVRAVVLTSSDPRNRVFCPGMDLHGASAKTGGDAGLGGLAMGDPSESGPAPDEEELRRMREAHRDGGGQVSLAIYRCAKPVIAAIDVLLNGDAVGVGVTMTLPCSLRVVSSAARVGFVFARRGINAEACSTYFLPRILGAGRALALLTLGAVLPATDPQLRDLWADVVAPDAVLPRALELADEIARKTSGVATRAMKDMIYRGNPSSPEAAYRLESRVFFDLFRGPDSREGIRSFLEKREPAFEGVWERDRPSIWPWWEEGKEEEGLEKSAPAGPKSKM
ncbi:enoyl-CoA hydratase/isomerase [Xylariaceae sp. FL0804]|nr:enoyl-CoA hydratase/isomerase [Xylariaceae sp. FL0804]